MLTNKQLDSLWRLCAAAVPAPWKWRYPNNKEASDVVWFEPFTDGSAGAGFENNLITRDSGVYGPNIATCEFIMAARSLVPQLITDLRQLHRVLELAREVDRHVDWDDGVPPFTRAGLALRAELEKIP